MSSQTQGNQDKLEGDQPQAPAVHALGQPPASQPGMEVTIAAREAADIPAPVAQGPAPPPPTPHLPSRVLGTRDHTSVWYPFIHSKTTAGLLGRIPLTGGEAVQDHWRHPDDQGHREKNDRTSALCSTVWSLRSSLLSASQIWLGRVAAR
ncbi:hypothetical protein BDR07DRAFT_1376774 [Suillus spraguei]|nr:hypothetical protein BDR07DRAFT_1376774 [Suillus spraguei]